tara:strand:+ start:416 stop:1072 length:657 start_codon:yes stop_codon:yes gene_type:complete
MDKTKKLIYEMLTECTGKHMCDSGFDNGRHWQRNQKKTIEDFENEPEEHIYKEDGYIYRDLSVFHYLSELELDDICNSFNRVNSNCQDWDAEINGDIFVYGVSKEAWQHLKSLPDTRLDNTGNRYKHLNIKADIKIINSWNTYNYENDLTQCLQGANLTINEDKYILIQIHNGADVRGGYTDAKLFKLNDEGLIHSYLFEWSEQYELEQRLEEDLIIN